MEYLDFEQPIAALRHRIKALRQSSSRDTVDLADEIHKLEVKCAQLTKKIYAHLNDWQIVQVARHPDRPYCLDYLENIFENFIELHGDRHFADDAAIVSGVGKFAHRSVAFVGHQKGRETKDKVRCNFGMPQPEGYRKALRIMRLAERFRMPILTFIDTPGAYPGIEAEERGQSEAIAYNLQQMSQLRTPIISTVIGEGGSGGALGIGVCDYLLMLQYATYSVISPEGCASILWRSAEKAPEAASAMHLTATKLKALGLVDKIVLEPRGGAHQQPKLIYRRLQEALEVQLSRFSAINPNHLQQQRYQRLMAMTATVKKK